VIGNAGHSEYLLHHRDFSCQKMGKISALPTVTKGMIGARWRSAILTKASRWKSWI
jgi:hypothetical protein